MDANIPPEPHPGKTPVWLNALAIGLVVLSAGLCLAMPFWGDQALFTLYARQMLEGAVLYRDILDVKQPGIFLFYAAGGLLFGFTEVGIHLFELIYWLAFSIFVLVALPPYFTTRWGAPLVPVFTIAVYYCYAGLLDLGQVEILVAFPLLAAWWLFDRADPATREGLRRYAAAGLAGAAVVLLKHLYLLIVVAFLVHARLRSRRRGTPSADLQRALAAFLIMLVVPLLAVVGYFAIYGQLGRIWWAYFEMTPAAQLSHRPISYLVVGGRRFLIGHGPLLILAVMGCLHALRERRGPRQDLVTGMLLWGSVGAVTFLGLQGWPEYKWALFTVPLGILAVVGAEVLTAFAMNFRTSSRRLALVAGTTLALVSAAAGAPAPRVQTQLVLSVAVGASAGLAAELLHPRFRMSSGLLYVLTTALGIAAGLFAIAPAGKIRALAEHDFALTADARTRFQQSLNESYIAADGDLEVLRRGNALPGSIYVFGDPILLLRANRPQAVPILGWGPEFLDRRAWEELRADLQSTLPTYMVVDASMESLIRRRCPAITELIASKYTFAFAGGSGAWYVLRETGRRDTAQPTNPGPDDQGCSS